MFTPSPHQQAAFDFVEKGTGNLILRAGAGSGKTTTLVEMIRRVTGTSIFLAFNKSIAEELKNRGVNARTFHSLVFSPVLRARGAREGAVIDRGEKWEASDFSAGDFVICLITKPLVSLAYQLMRAHQPAYIMGKEIGEGLVSLIKKLNAKGVDALRERLAVYTAREVEKANAKKQEDKAQLIQDKSECIAFLIDALPETSRTVPELIRVIEGLFSSKADAVVLSTIHKAKGLEANRVFWINRGFRCYAPRQDRQIQQETNLRYVAATRAKQELVLIDLGGGR